MSRLRFSDGVEFETSGPLRIERRADGYYVVGEGVLCPCDSRADAERLLLELATPDDGGTA